jgi:uncharacterized protein with GYD domain
LDAGNGNPKGLGQVSVVEGPKGQGGQIMATYLMFGSYSQESARKISAKRTDETKELIEKHGGKLTAAYALLGEKDIVLIVDLPTTEQAMKTSVVLSRMLGIGFSTMPAVSIEAFDKLTADL